MLSPVNKTNCHYNSNLLLLDRDKRYNSILHKNMKKCEILNFCSSLEVYLEVDVALFAKPIGITSVFGVIISTVHIIRASPACVSNSEA